MERTPLYDELLVGRFFLFKQLHTLKWGTIKKIMIKIKNYKQHKSNISDKKCSINGS